MNACRLLRSTVWVMALSIPVAVSADPPEVKSQQPAVSRDEMDFRPLWQIPPDINIPSKITTESLQTAFDAFSWESFIALSWPANKLTSEPVTI